MSSRQLGTRRPMVPGVGQGRGAERPRGRGRIAHPPALASCPRPVRGTPSWPLHLDRACSWGSLPYPRSTLLSPLGVLSITTCQQTAGDT